MKTNPESVRVGTLKELEAKNCMVVRLDQAVAVFHNDGKVFAVETVVRTWDFRCIGAAWTTASSPAIGTTHGSISPAAARFISGLMTSQVSRRNARWGSLGAGARTAR